MHIEAKPKGIDRNGALKINRHFSLSSKYFLTEDIPLELKV